MVDVHSKDVVKYIKATRGEVQIDIHGDRFVVHVSLREFEKIIERYNNSSYKEFCREVRKFSRTKA